MLCCMVSTVSSHASHNTVSAVCFSAENTIVCPDHHTAVHREDLNVAGVQYSR